MGGFLHFHSCVWVGGHPHPSYSAWPCPPPIADSGQPAPSPSSGTGARVNRDTGTARGWQFPPTPTLAGGGGGPRVPVEPITAVLCPGGGCVYLQPGPPAGAVSSACLAPAEPRSAPGGSEPPRHPYRDSLILWGNPKSLTPSGMAQPVVSVKSLVSSYETRVGGTAPGPPRKRGCVSSPCSPRGVSPIRAGSAPPSHRGLGGPAQRPSPRRGMDKTLLSLILCCHRCGCTQ